MFSGERSEEDELQSSRCPLEAKDEGRLIYQQTGFTLAGELADATTSYSVKDEEPTDETVVKAEASRKRSLEEQAPRELSEESKAKIAKNKKEAIEKKRKREEELSVNDAPKERYYQSGR